MGCYKLTTLLAVAFPSVVAAEPVESDVHTNYNMGIMEYFIGRTDTGGFGLNCQDKPLPFGPEGASIGIYLPEGSSAEGKQVIFSGEDGTSVELDLGEGELISFDNYENWDTFTQVWKMVRTGEEITVTVGDNAPMKLTTAGATEVMPAAPCNKE